MTTLAQNQRETARKPLPTSGWSTRIEIVRQAVVVPPVTREFVQRAGVLRKEGSYVGQGALWRKFRPLTTAPDMPQGPVAELPGKWLWGGVLWRHFGHFLVESTGRLWGLNGFPDGLDGVLFIPKSPDAGNKLEPYQAEFMALAKVPGEVKICLQPVQPEVLYVPGQGFGLGPIASGTAHARAFFQHRFAQDIAPDGPERLFISRSGLGRGRGKLVCEDLLDEHLAAQGYEVFHPQHHDLSTQIARYKAAKQIIASEGSAIHLLAMVARPHQRLAVVIRRMSAATSFILQHYKGFTGVDPVVVNHISGGWLPEGYDTRRHQVSELDFAATQTALQQAGFITSGEVWTQPAEQQRQTSLAAIWDKPLRFIPASDEVEDSY